jgi:hypothetical protein
MITFTLISLGIGAWAAFWIWFELSVINDKVEFLSQRLNKLEKDAVKVTFTDVPEYHGVRTTPEDVNKILNYKPLIEGDNKSQSKGDTGKTKAAPPRPISANPKVMGEWQTKNGRPKIMGHKRDSKS